MKITATLSTFDTDPAFPNALHYSYQISIGVYGSVFWHIYRKIGSNKAEYIYNPHMSDAVSERLAVYVLASMPEDGAPVSFEIEA